MTTSFFYTIISPQRGGGKYVRFTGRNIYFSRNRLSYF